MGLSIAGYGVGGGTSGRGSTYPLFLGNAGNNATPADGAQMILSTGVLSSTLLNRDHICLIAGNVTKVVLRMNYTVGTSETSTIRLKVNGGFTNLFTLVDFSVASPQTLTVQGLSVPVAIGDTIGIEWTCPTWVTNPTNVCFTADILIVAA